MRADRERLQRVRDSLATAIDDLEASAAPAGITDQVELAMIRLDRFLDLLNTWNNGDGPAVPPKSR